ncbi:MAG: hypothetical protein AVDCRST_MAG52-2876 [uncultured Blastococcus sp.]|uniref:Uncharacterized protein n=1 Tax=uncultured Blastococcus sp. TaxID=217144 RepID=A0A6J4IU94_9ACTN|nr:MAG: hypothetical protein AVDCRST_MAG52-2876 [uncultured Blastococcus sp.]
MTRVTVDCRVIGRSSPVRDRTDARRSPDTDRCGRRLVHDPVPPTSHR